MMRSMLCFFGLLPLLACSAFAGTFYVGTCQASGFASLADAVASSKVSPGSIINICPGSYEQGQVVISKPLTIKGMTGISALGTPTGATFNFGESGGTEATSLVLGTTLDPMIWITASPVNISNIYADMNQGGFTEEGVPCGRLNPAIFYASGSSGSVNHVSIRASEEENWDGSGCGVGVWAEDATADGKVVKIENSTIQSNNYGIVAASLQPQGFAPVLNISITGNQISQFENGIYLFHTRGVVSGNNIINGATNTMEAILQDAPSTVVTKNTINVLLGDGIDILENFTTVTDNKIWAGATDIDFGCNTATVTGNTLNFAIYGLNHVPASFTGKNAFFNIARTIAGC